MGHFNKLVGTPDTNHTTSLGSWQCLSNISSVHNQLSSTSIQSSLLFPLPACCIMTTEIIRRYSYNFSNKSATLPFLLFFFPMQIESSFCLSNSLHLGSQSNSFSSSFSFIYLSLSFTFKSFLSHVEQADKAKWSTAPFLSPCYLLDASVTFFSP